MKFTLKALLFLPALGEQYLDQLYKDNLELDLWTPPNYPCGVARDAERPSTPTPLIVHIYGGAWKGGSKEDVCQTCGSASSATIISKTAKKTTGAVLSMNYELTTTGAHMPKQIQDVIDAVNWVLKDADKYNVDPSKVVCSGLSAGGLLCALLATYSAEQRDSPHGPPPMTTLRAALAFFPPIDFLILQDQTKKDICVGRDVDHDNPNSPESKLVGAQDIGGLKAVKADPDSYPEIYNRTVNTNPQTFLSNISPPMFLRAGSCDELIPHWQTKNFGEALTAAGVEVDWKIIWNAKHACSPLETWQSHSVKGIKWLVEKLGDPTPSSV